MSRPSPTTLEQRLAEGVVVGAEVLELFAALHRAGTTVLMITHDPVVASRAQRRLVLDAGRLAAAA